MKIMKPILQFQTLNVRLIALIIIIMTTFTLVLGITTSQIVGNWMAKIAVANLESLASARQTAIEAQLLNYHDSLHTFISPHGLQNKISEMLAANGAEQATLHKKVTNILRRKKMVNDYLEWVDIVDTTGTIIVSTIAEREGLKRKNVTGKGKMLVHDTISDLFIEDGKVYLELSTPFHNSQEIPVAMLIIRFNAQAILAITGDYTGLGKTGETVLGTRRGDKVYFLAPLRFDPNLSEVKPALASGDRAKPMIHATAGQSGVIHAPDYRQERVIAAYRPIFSTNNWGLVVKQDEDEVLSSVSQLKYILFTALIVLLLISMIITIPLVHNFTKPLRDLEQATKQVTDGNLTITVPVMQHDEVGRLAEAFNVMVVCLREVRDDLEHSNQELTSFAYVVSHDLKAPLRSIANLVEWLEEDTAGTLDKEHLEYINLIRGRVQRMDSLINGLLEYSRVGQMKNPIAQVDVEKLLEAVIDMIGVPNNIAIITNSHLPTIQADKLLLGQVFQNLIDNAVKYHPGPQGKVEISCRDVDAHWEFCVSDDGMGIAPKHHEHIFGIFQALHISNKIESTGIGLALVKKIVEEWDGQVWVKSDGTPGQGTKFYFTCLKLYNDKHNRK